MATKTELLTVEATTSRARVNPILTVVGWELQRVFANRMNWVVAALTLLFFVALIWFKHVWYYPVKDGASDQVIFLGTTAYGLVNLTVNVLALFLGILLPFVCVEAVARDYRQRMHEILMTTSLPTWAFVVGRYIVALLLSLVLGLLMLLAVIGMGLVLHFQEPIYPIPQMAFLVQLWAVVVIPAIVFISAVAFALGTFKPRWASILRVAVLLGWVMLYILGFALQERFGAWLVYWSPQSGGVWQIVVANFMRTYTLQIANVSNVAQQNQIAMQLQQTAPDLSAWFLPHLGLMVIGVALVVLAAFRFQRFRDVME